MVLKNLEFSRFNGKWVWKSQFPHFLAVSSLQKSVGGMPIGFWKKSIFGTIGSLKGAKIAIFCLRGALKAPPNGSVNPIHL